jgi:hypothetical protein
MLTDRFWRKRHGLQRKKPCKQARSARILPFEWKMFYVEQYVMFEKGLLWLNVLYAERK